MQTDCEPENPARTYGVRFAGSQDVDWIAHEVQSKMAHTRDWPLEVAKTWVRWFIAHRFAAVLEAGRLCCGLLLVRPFNNLARAATEYYFYEDGGRSAWIDAIISPDTSCLASFFDFILEHAFTADRICYLNKNRPGIRTANLRRIHSHFKGAQQLKGNPWVA